MVHITTYPFSQEDSKRAFDEWGANCGPNALAFVLASSLDDVRPLIPGFEEKRYTSPSMMAAALNSIGADVYKVQRPSKDDMFFDTPALVRIQWCGPWTKTGSNPKWAYRQTHWIVAWNTDANHPFGEPMIFDCNCGIVHAGYWETETMPRLIQQYPRASGEWLPTHVWRVN